MNVGQAVRGLVQVEKGGAAPVGRADVESQPGQAVRNVLVKPNGIFDMVAVHHDGEAIAGLVNVGASRVAMRVGRMRLFPRPPTREQIVVDGIDFERRLVTVLLFIRED